MERLSGLIKIGGGAQALKVRIAELLNESRECFDRLNICNRSKLLEDIMTKLLQL